MSSLAAEIRMGADGPEMLHDGKWYTFAEVWNKPYISAQAHPDWDAFAARIRNKAKLADMKAKLAQKRKKERHNAEN